MSSSMPPDADGLRRAYLSRLGLEEAPISVEQLFMIHRRQVERVPYETLWIALGDACGVEPQTCYRRIATGRHGGYCFILNGGLGELLRVLGYRVVRHVGAVHGPAGLMENEIANHLVLTVHDLPTADNPNGVWYVDAGLGDALHQPLPLIPGRYRQEPFELVLEPHSNGFGDWHLRHDPAGSFAGMFWRAESAPPGSFDRQHVRLSTSAESGFVRVLTAFRRYENAVDILRGLVLRRLGASASESLIENQDELFDILGDTFGLDTAQIPSRQRESIWRRVYEAHLEWMANEANQSLQQRCK